jgi:hypothetical protein
VSPTAWLTLLAEYKRRKTLARTRKPLLRAGLAAPAAPFVPGARNWLPLGPSVVILGQTVGNEPVGGRVSGLAVAPGGQLVYAASANGGIFRSSDGGTTWKSMMDGFDLDPTEFASTSISCGAVAIDPNDPNRVYVGTGEGDTDHLFRQRIVGALPAYRGIGPIRSDNGGIDWTTEAIATGSPPLAGQSFFALAVDPTNRENVIGATTQGLYQRLIGPDGVPTWTQRRSNEHSGVVATSSGGATRFFAAQWGAGVFHSDDGVTWNASGTGFPATDVGRIALAVQQQNSSLVYAFVVNTKGALLGVYRLDDVAGAWSQINNAPDVLPVGETGGSQGDYDLAIAVDPANASLLYLGGSYSNPPSPNVPNWPWPGSIWRCPIVRDGADYRVDNPASIGTHAHADVHVLVHTPGDPTELWCGCDGGVFLNRDPGGTGEFAGQNNGLACLCSNFMAQHPTDPSILFTGLQDNGTARTSGGSVWTHVNGGDGGYCVINWANPNLVLTYANGSVYRSSTGGTSESSWSKNWEFNWATMTQPIVTPPYNPASPSDADIVAVAAGLQVSISEDFADSWSAALSVVIPPISPADAIFALAFASPTRLFIGTTGGRVLRADRSGNGWTVTRIDDVSAGPLGLVGIVTDVAIDWSDANQSSIYLSFGGALGDGNDRRRIWRFDGSKWESRSGPANGNNLLSVEHNTVIVDRTAPNNIYTGADIGVWHSADSGLNWEPFENGLPDAPVFDLQIHPTQRLLRAATHGRGVYEISLP